MVKLAVKLPVDLRSLLVTRESLRYGDLTDELYEAAPGQAVTARTPLTLTSA